MTLISPRLARSLLAVTAVIGQLVLGPPAAQAIGDDPVATTPTPNPLTHQATPNTSPFDLPGGALNLNLTQGETVWLYTTGLNASTTWALELPDPGVSFIVSPPARQGTPSPAAKARGRVEPQ